MRWSESCSFFEVIIPVSPRSYYYYFNCYNNVFDAIWMVQVKFLNKDSSLLGLNISQVQLSTLVNLVIDFFQRGQSMHWSALYKTCQNFFSFPLLIDLVTVFDAILKSRETCEKLQCLYENLMWNNFRRTAVLKNK